MAQGQHGWYSPEEKINYIEEYFNSGLSLTDYCKNIDLKRSTLATWIRHYNSANLLAGNTFQDITPIVKQDITPIIKSTKIKITLPNKMIIEFDSTELKNVMAELK